MKFSFGVVLCFAALVAVTLAQRGNFRQFNNNNNNNNNFRQFNNNNNNNNNNFRPVQQVQQQPRQQQFDIGLDTSDGRFAKFNGPVRGLPHGHGGGRYGAADCLLCPNGF
ncbi:unnamed protein product [Orchesella dallaii]|uniref:Uncharacterized protein n=1 Tax=Orchesella dallaii TaxID=48710 RepID=A0ABP1QEQ9_9HEXA